MAHYDRNSGSHISGMVAQACRTGGSLEHRLFILVQFVKKLPYLDINISKKIIPELHSVLRRTVFLEKDNVTVVINIIKMCYDIFKKATGKRLKDGLDGMYNISNLAKTYHKYLKDNNVEIDTKFDTLIDEFKSCKLNEVKFCWL